MSGNIGLGWKSKIELTKSSAQSASEKYKCTHCLDTGWLLKTVVDETDLHYTPRGNRMSVGSSYATPCPFCSTKDETSILGSGIESRYKGKGYDGSFWTPYKDDCSKKIQLVNDYVANQPDWTYGLYIWSKQRGSGKTELASRILQSVKIKHGTTVKFVSVTDYLYKLKEAYKADKAGGYESTKLVSDLLAVDLLCLDDLGAEKRTEWTDQELFHLINTRYNQGRKTLITSNDSMREVAEDPRLTDRLREVCIEIHMPEQSVRSEKAQTRQMDFLQHRNLQP